MSKAKRGRPTDFNEKVCAHIIALAEEGKTDKQIAKAIGVSEKTINNWKVKNTDFFQSLKDAKDIADQLVEATLFERAIGYKHKEVKVFCHQGMIVTHEVEKVYPPDVTAMIFWLKNRQPDRWRDKQKDEDEGQPSATPGAATPLSVSDLAVLVQAAKKEVR